MAQNDLLERLVAVETKVEMLANQHGMLLKELQSLNCKMDDERVLLTRYKGFAGGAMFVFSALFMALSLFKEWILKHLT